MEIKYNTDDFSVSSGVFYGKFWNHRGPAYLSLFMFCGGLEPLFRLITGSHSFFILTYRYPEVSCSRHVAVFLKTSVLKEVRILYSSSQ